MTQAVPSIPSGDRVGAEPPRPKHHFATDHLLADLKGRSVRGGTVTLAAQGIKFTLQMGSTMVLARLLTPADFGLIAMVAAFTGFVSLFKDLGLSMATVQRAEITHAQVSTLFWINVGLSVFLTGVGTAIAPAIAWFYGEPRLFWITVAISATFIFGGLSAQHTALLRRQMRFKHLAIIEISSMAIGIAVAITMAWNGLGYWALVGLVAGTAMGNCAFAWLYSGWRPGSPHGRCGAGAMVRFGGHLTGFSVLNHVSRNADNVLIGAVWGVGSLGIYSKAYGLLMLPLKQITGPVSSVAVPALSRLQHDPIRFRQAFVGLIENIAFVTMPLMVFLVCGASEVIRVLLGEQWMEAASIFAWLGLAAILQPVSSACGLLYIAQDRTREFMAWGFLSSALTVSSFVVGLQWGAVGVAMSYALMDIFIKTPLLWWHVGRRGAVGFSDIERALRLPIMAAVTSLLLFAGIREYIDPPRGISTLLLAATILSLVHIFAYAAVKRGRAQVISTWSLAQSTMTRSDARS